MDREIEEMDCQRGPAEALKIERYVQVETHPGAMTERLGRFRRAVALDAG